AAQDLQIRVRQLRFHSMLYLMDPAPERLGPIAQDERNFADALAVARRTATDEAACVREIEDAYRQFQEEQARLRAAVVRDKPATEYPKIADSHPVRY